MHSPKPGLFTPSLDLAVVVAVHVDQICLVCVANYLHCVPNHFLEKALKVVG